MAKEVILQVFTGGFLKAETDFSKIASKLHKIMSNITIKKVLIGWNTDNELLKKTKELVHQYDAELFLWIPVFSEGGLLKDMHLLVDEQLNQVKNFEFKEGETFEFYCPNQERNIEHFIEIYEENFKNIGFDGIFIDKIRYGAFSNGLSGVFNCFCPECIKKYKDYNIDINQLKSEMKKVRTGTDGYQKIPLKIKQYEHGNYMFEQELWQSFFEFKKDSMTNALKKITDYFSSNQLKIGMDVLSPFMAYFAGQDLKVLKDMTDFMKPMMYRITAAPAGLPFEYDNFLKETLFNYDESAKVKMNEVLNITGTTYPEFEFDFIKRELDDMTDMGIPVYCGIEINRIENIAPVTPTYINNYLKSLEKTEICGYVLSWNLLSAPDENIEQIITYFK